MSLMSMTGQAHHQVDILGLQYNIKLITLNHRYFEFSLRAPRLFQSLESEILEYFKKNLVRGKASLWIDSPAHGFKTMGIAKSSKRFASVFREMKNDPNLKEIGEEKIFQLAITSSEIWKNEEKSYQGIRFKKLKPVFDKIILDLEKSRSAEGFKTQKLIAAHLKKIARTLKKIEQSIPHIKKQWEKFKQDRLHKILEQFAVKIDDNRLLQELLILNEKREVAEEMGRVDIHLGACLNTLTSQETSQGKRLDFLMQELQREFTTLGNKIKDAHCAQCIIDAKLEIEKIREQALNLI